MPIKVTPELGAAAKEAVFSEMRTAMDGFGLSAEYLTKKLKQELNAKEVKAFNNNGEVIYSKGLPAMAIRQKARMDAHKLRGDYPAEKLEHSGLEGGPIRIKRVSAED